MQIIPLRRVEVTIASRYAHRGAGVVVIALRLAGEREICEC